MKKTSLWALMVLMLWFVNSAYAYLDPGTGSYIIQVLIASVVGFFFVIKSQWQKIVIWVKSKLGNNGDI